LGGKKKGEKKKDIFFPRTSTFENLINSSI